MKISHLVSLGAIGAALAIPALPLRDARACGGSFSSVTVPQSERVAVKAQQIALSLSSQRTVLWSKIEYAGPPGEFAWVLPVGPGARLELAEDAWFEALGAVTSPFVTASPMTCPESSGAGCGCGSAADAGGSRGGSADVAGVQVVHQGSVGPYETVTLSAAKGDSIQTWLETNGYAVPAEVAPILDAYAKQGLDFLAMRLKAGATVLEMQPVRVITEGASPIVPMRMMTAGAGETVPLTLFVIGEGRYGSQSFPAAEVDLSALAWDYTSESSNFASLLAEAEAKEGGRAFVTTFASPDFESPAPAPLGGGEAPTFVLSDGTRRDNFVNLYFAQAALDASEPRAAECAGVATALSQYGGQLVMESCDPHDSGCAPYGERILSSVFACDGSTDLATALVGMRPEDVWITRLDANLPRGALQDDLVLEAATPQAPVSNVARAGKHGEVPEGCTVNEPVEGASASLRAPRRQLPSAPLFALSSALAICLARRRTRRVTSG